MARSCTSSLPFLSHTPFSPQTSSTILTQNQKKYLPGDLKGKGEPSYSIEKALKDHKEGARDHRRVMSEGQPAYEMVPTANRRTTGRPGLEARSSSYGNANTNPERQQRYSDWERERPRSSGGGGLRKRIGSLRRED